MLCVHEQGIQKWADKDWQDEDSAGEVSDEDGHSRTATTNPYENSSYQRDDAVSAVSSGLKAVNLAAHNNAYGHKASKTGSTVITQSDLLGSNSDIGVPNETSGNDKRKGKETETATSNWQNFAGTKRRDEPVEFTGYDSKGGAHRQVRSPSTIASERSVEIVTDRPRGRSGPSQPKGGNSRFAKAPRGPSPALRKDSMITVLKAGATGRTVSYSDDEDTDGEWGTM
ncbi:MAG: hypothetical protein Q9211_002234 [Gyalolechia sp. 1 TL-2023]